MLMKENLSCFHLVQLPLLVCRTLSAWPQESDNEVGGDLLPFASENAIHTLHRDCGGTKRENLLSFMPSLMDELIFCTNSFWHGAKCLSLSVEPNRQDTYRGMRKEKLKAVGTPWVAAIIGLNLIYMILKSSSVNGNHEYNIRVQLEYKKRYLQNNVSL